MSDLVVKVKKLREDSKMLKKATDGSACYDVYASLDTLDSIMIREGQSVKIGIGLALEIEPGWCALIFARSGMASKYRLAPSNKVAVIDSDFRGEIMVDLFNEGQIPQFVHHGDRIAQIMFVPVHEAQFLEVDELSDTERGTGGFGSTGK